MATLTANNLSVSSADFVLPISRVWHVDMTVTTDDASQLNGKVTISIGDGALTLKGTSKVEGVYLGTVRARVIAGAGGMAFAADCKAYDQPTVKIVLSDLLATAGETLSTTASQDILGRVLPAWTVREMPIADAIGLLMDEVEASWRMLADGTFWCGKETWPDSGLDFSLEQNDEAHQQAIVSMESPLLMPGVSLGGRKVSYVETHVDADEVKSTVWYVSPTSTDRMRDPIVAMTKSSVPHIDYYGLYRAAVVGQSADLLTLDLMPDDLRLPRAGIKAPIRHGLPGCKVQVPAGKSVLLGWMDGDPSKPYCALWEGGESPQKIQLAGTHPLPLWDQFLRATGALKDIMNIIEAALTKNCVNGSPLIVPFSADDLKLAAFQTALQAGTYDSQIVSNG